MKKVVFVGNPNVGKSALINALSGSNLIVGNWPGVTVEKIEAIHNINGEQVNLIDLPGTYDLTATTNEENITFDFLVNEKPDLIINVVDSTNLERNLYLTLLLREMQIKMILVLNYADELEKLGTVVDENRLSKYLQMPVVKTSPVKNIGINQLDELIGQQLASEFKQFNIFYNHDIDTLFVKYYNLLTQKEYQHAKLSNTYVTMRLLENNQEFVGELDQDLQSQLKQDLEKLDHEQMTSSLDYIQVARFGQLNGIVHKVVDEVGVSRLKMTKSIDDILLNKVWGLPLLLVFSIFFMTIVFSGSAPLIDWVDGFINNYIGKYIEIALQGSPDWLNSMIVDGIIGGVGGVLVFTPLMYFIYFFMALVEESGYMARIAFLMDRVMGKLGLNGKSFISMILGFGCGVPGIISTRTLEDERSRKITALLVPFMSCGARLPVYSLFAAAFFGPRMPLVIISLYGLGILMAVLIAVLLNRFNIFKMESKPLLIELPPYRMPNMKMVTKNVNNRVKHYFEKATTVIFVVLFILWGLTYFPTGNTQESFLVRGTKAIQPIFEPAGFGTSWEAVAAIPGSIAAKEAVVGFLGQVLEVEQPDDHLEPNFIADTTDQLKGLVVAAKDSVVSMTGINKIIASDAPAEDDSPMINAAKTLWPDEKGPLRAYAYMAFILLVIPCVVTLATVKKEFSTSFMWVVVGVMTIIPWLVSTLIFQIGSLFY